MTANQNSSKADTLLDILPPYNRWVRVWGGGVFSQNDLVPKVGMAVTYSVLLASPEEAPNRFLTVQENRITNLMAHQPIPKKSVFDAWGRYLGQGGETLERRYLMGPPMSMVELATHDQLRMDQCAGTTQKPAPKPSTLESESNEESRSHRFWLRKDLKIKITLPLDLTREEAKRIAVFVKTLPLLERK